MIKYQIDTVFCNNKKHYLYPFGFNTIIIIDMKPLKHMGATRDMLGDLCTSQFKMSMCTPKK